MPNPLDYNRAKPLFMLPDRLWAIDDAPHALESIYSQDKPVLIYLHGRAKGIGEPRKSVEENIYANLTKYDVATIGFTWDSDDPGYDETRPIASADDFARFLDYLGDYLRANPQAAKPSLLAHSMGNIIVAELAKDDLLGTARGPLMANIVLSAAAVKQKRHHRWLEKIRMAERNYVMVNPHDRVLKFAGFGFKPNMLGQDLRTPGVTPELATYVSLEQLGVKHRYFVKPGQKKQANLRSFYAQALSGATVDFGPIADPRSIDGVPVMSIRPTVPASGKQSRIEPVSAYE
ncbi:MAG: alpha/beta hydrolase [Candidatus Thiodiazotropha sp.]